MIYPNTTLFREYDIRGIVDDTLFAADAFLIGRAFAHEIFKAGGETIVLGWDGRLSSPILAQALSEGLTTEGIQVLQLGLAPTPLVYFAEQHLKADASISLTGSHNPPNHNGFKLTLKSKPFFGAQIKELEQSIVRLPALQQNSKKGGIKHVSALEAYLDVLRAEVPQDKPLRVVWDAGHGVAGFVIEELLKRLPGDHKGLFLRVDGNFPAHHPDPTVPENMNDLAQAVQEGGYDLGVAFDGDGDRVGVVDHQGRLLWGDQLLMILAREVLQQQPGATIIADIKTSQAFEKDIKDHGGVPLYWKTGHSNMKSKMRAIGAPLAGEMSGHIFFADRYGGYDDGLYAAVRLIRYLAQSGQRLADLYDALPVFGSSPELRFECQEEEKFAIVERVKASAHQAGLSFTDVDGIRVTLPEGWWLLRASNTQNVLVARYEAENLESLDVIRKNLQQHLKAAGITGLEAA